MNLKISKPIISHPDRISGAVIALLGLFLLYVASPLPVGKLNAPDAGFFPVILSIMLTGLGIILFANSFRSERSSLEMTPRTPSVAACAAVLLLYALLVNRIGFLICTLSVLLVLMRAYGGLSWRTSLLIGLPAVLAAYLGFNELGVPLPRGILDLVLIRRLLRTMQSVPGIELSIMAPDMFEEFGFTRAGEHAAHLAS